MKLTCMIDEENFKNYAPDLPPEWEITHLGNRPADAATLAATGAQAILIDPMLPMTGEMMAALPELKIIHSFGVGYNRIDLEAARQRGIYVCNNAGVNAVAVAEQTVLLMLAVLRNYHEGEAMVYAARQGEFKGRCFRRGLRELGECRVGLLGLGAIGKEVALRLAGFGCEIWYYKPHPISHPEDFHAEPHTREEILSQCDIVSLHLPVNPDTEHLICERTLGMMKPGAILINTSRGELVDQDAVCRALKAGTLGGFGADTLAPEPVQPDNPFLALPEEIRCRMALSPHIGGITASTFVRSYRKAIGDMEAALLGRRPENIVNHL